MVTTEPGLPWVTRGSRLTVLPGPAPHPRLDTGAQLWVARLIRGE
ncbi:MAG TPA: hypothetical protein VHC18_13455 [Amycolatopsis sp.]|nr:hypothetical protein [Amycolatopsis sp.]